MVAQDTDIVDDTAVQPRNHPNPYPKLYRIPDDKCFKVAWEGHPGGNAPLLPDRRDMISTPYTGLSVSFASLMIREVPTLVDAPRDLP
jgi:hypothetical protein